MNIPTYTIRKTLIFPELNNLKYISKPRDTFEKYIYVSNCSIQNALSDLELYSKLLNLKYMYIKMFQNVQFQTYLKSQIILHPTSTGEGLEQRLKEEKRL